MGVTSYPGSEPRSLSVCLSVCLSSGSVINHYKGFAGGVRSLQCRSGSDGRSLVAGCGLDRYLRVFQMDPPRLLHQVSCHSTR